MRVKEESEKTGLKLNNKETKIMESSPITSRKIEGENVETMTDFIFLGSKITVDSDLQSWNYKTFAPWKEGYDKPRSVSCSVMPDSLWPHWLACQAPLSMGFSRQGYWSE